MFYPLKNHVCTTGFEPANPIFVFMLVIFYSMGKTMCKLGKKERLEKQEGDELKYKCKSCGEKARKEKHLCDPKKL